MFKTIAKIKATALATMGDGDPSKLDALEIKEEAVADIKAIFDDDSLSMIEQFQKASAELSEAYVQLRIEVAQVEVALKSGSITGAPEQAEDFGKPTQ